MKKASPRKGDIYLLNFPMRSRFFIILSNNIANEHSKIITVAPIAENIVKVYTFEVVVDVNGKRYKVMLNQIGHIEKAFLKSNIGSINEEEMQNVEIALKISLGMS
jgi:mRNA-degrading endonuclease toxin of MazEF toxin-antitoxin module